MIWLVVTIAAVCTAFIALVFGTSDIWTAADSAGILVLVFLIASTVRMTRAPVTRRVRAIVVLALALGIAGISFHWISYRSATEFQYNALLAIRRQIERGAFSAILEERSLSAFTAYYRQQVPAGKSLSAVFDEMNPRIDRTANLLDTLGEGMKVYASTVSDSEVVIVGVSGFTFGRDRAFRNRDGRTGLLQSRLRLTPGGVEYAIEN